ncbi:hypothetical protein CRG98_013804 [Punica granatum]|uniref:Uncharacterized protein n=1 Tax=Punica granatum TaxID=22663 RepID=A0A2I0KB85_PUNGR|nr:hypothetical protein CRG98_013804 [Punica granatum]
MNSNPGFDRGFSHRKPVCQNRVLTAVIYVFYGCAPKIHREAFVITETSIGRPSRVPKGPRPVKSSRSSVPGPRLLLVYLNVRFGDPFASWGIVDSSSPTKDRYPGKT